MLGSKDEIAALNADDDFLRLMEESGFTVTLTVSKVHFPIVPEIIKHCGFQWLYCPLFNRATCLSPCYHPIYSVTFVAQTFLLAYIVQCRFLDHRLVTLYKINQIYSFLELS